MARPYVNRTADARAERSRAASSRARASGGCRKETSRRSSELPVWRECVSRTDKNAGAVSAGHRLLIRAPAPGPLWRCRPGVRSSKKLRRPRTEVQATQGRWKIPAPGSHKETIVNFEASWNAWQRSGQPGTAIGPGLPLNLLAALPRFALVHSWSHARDYARSGASEPKPPLSLSLFRSKKGTARNPSAAACMAQRGLRAPCASRPLLSLS